MRSRKWRSASSSFFFCRAGDAAVVVLAGVLGVLGELLEGLRLLRRRRVGRAAEQAQLLHLLLELVDPDREGVGEGLDAHLLRVVLQESQFRFRPAFDHSVRPPGPLVEKRRIVGSAAPAVKCGNAAGTRRRCSGRVRERIAMRSRARRRPSSALARLAAGAAAAPTDKTLTATGTVAQRRRPPSARSTVDARRRHRGPFVWNADTKINGVADAGREGHDPLRRRRRTARISPSRSASRAADGRRRARLPASC